MNADATAYQDYLRLMRRCAGALGPFWTKNDAALIGSTAHCPIIATFAKLGLKLRGLGKADMREFLRIASLPARDLMDEFFDHPVLKAAH